MGTQNRKSRRRVFVLLTSAFLAATAYAPALAYVCTNIQKPGH